MILVSYINARGEEIILDDTERSFLGELYGREGTEAPSLKYTEILYGDGSTDLVLLNTEPRDVVLYFWAPTGTPDLRRKLEDLKRQLIQTGTRSGGWGKLKIHRPDGSLVYLNCVYTGGLNDIVREYPNAVKFSLTFRANDPLFYEGFETRYVIEADAADGYLMMKPLTFSGGYDFAEDNITANPDGVFLTSLTDTSHDDSSHNTGSVFFKSAASESEDEIELESQRVWPTITIAGSAKNIRIRNSLTGKKLEFAASVTVDGSHVIKIVTQPLHRKVVMVDVSTGAETSIIGKLTASSSLDFYLERGVNVIYYRNSESTPESSCTFAYTEGYLSAE